MSGFDQREQRVCTGGIGGERFGHRFLRAAGQDANRFGQRLLDGRRVAIDDGLTDVVTQRLGQRRVVNCRNQSSDACVGCEGDERAGHVRAGSETGIVGFNNRRQSRFQVLQLELLDQIGGGGLAGGNERRVQLRQFDDRGLKSSGRQPGITAVVEAVDDFEVSPLSGVLLEIPFHAAGHVVAGREGFHQQRIVVGAAQPHEVLALGRFVGDSQMAAEIKTQLFGNLKCR